MLSINGGTINSYTVLELYVLQIRVSFVITSVTMYRQRVQYVEMP